MIRHLAPALPPRPDLATLPTVRLSARPTPAPRPRWRAPDATQPMPQSPESENEMTRLLARMRDGDDRAAHELAPLVYGELHRLAHRAMDRQPPGHTLQPTALVNEAMLKLMHRSEANWENRAHFFAVASHSMRRILVDHARSKQRLKREAPGQRVTLEGLSEAFEERSIDLDSLDRGLERLAELDPRMVQLVEMRFFGGCSMKECAEILGMSLRTAEREWQTARSWLRKWMR